MTSATPASRSAWTHGPVRPWWLHGSRVTRTLAPRAEVPVAARFASASTSAWAVPAPRWWPSARMSPSGERMTQPTRGLGPGGASGEAAARRARCIAAVCTVVNEVIRSSPSGALGRDTAMIDRRVHGSGRGMVCPVCASHPDSHRRSRSSTWSAGRWMRPGRGLSPPVRTFTDPRAHELISLGRMYRARVRSVTSARLCDHPHLGRVSGCGRTAGGWPAPGLTSCGTGTWWRRRARW